MASILTFKGCIETVQVASDLKQCLVNTGIPLIFVLVIVLLKVSKCLLCANEAPLFV